LPALDLPWSRAQIRDVEVGGGESEHVNTPSP
jgi:hypothetical protein